MAVSDVVRYRVYEVIIRRIVADTTQLSQPPERQTFLIMLHPLSPYYRSGGLAGWVDLLSVVTQLSQAWYSLML